MKAKYSWKSLPLKHKMLGVTPVLLSMILVIHQICHQLLFKVRFAGVLYWLTFLTINSNYQLMVLLWFFLNWRALITFFCFTPLIYMFLHSVALQRSCPWKFIEREESWCICNVLAHSRNIISKTGKQNKTKWFHLFAEFNCHEKYSPLNRHILIQWLD